MYMIILQGQGDTNVAIVDQQAWDWINNPHNNPVPDILIKEVIKKPNDYGLEDIDEKTPREEIESAIRENQITRGSPNNDAALNMMFCADPVFYRMKEALDYVKKNDIEIIDTFEGYIY